MSLPLTASAAQLAHAYRHDLLDLGDYVQRMAPIMAQAHAATNWNRAAYGLPGWPYIVHVEYSN